MKTYLTFLRQKVSVKQRKVSTAWKVSKYGVFSGPYFPVFSPNVEKYRSEKLCIWTLFTQ